MTILQSSAHTKEIERAETVWNPVTYDHVWIRYSRDWRPGAALGGALQTSETGLKSLKKRLRFRFQE